MGGSLAQLQAGRDKKGRDRAPTKMKSTPAMACCYSSAADEISSRSTSALSGRIAISRLDYLLIAPRGCDIEKSPINDSG